MKFPRNLTTDLILGDDPYDCPVPGIFEGIFNIALINNVEGVGPWQRFALYEWSCCFIFLVFHCFILMLFLMEFMCLYIQLCLLVTAFLFEQFCKSRFYTDALQTG